MPAGNLPESSSERSLWLADRLASWTRVALYADLVILIAVLFAGVVGRYVFNRAILGEEDVAVTLLLFLVFLGSGQALRSGHHPSIHVLTARLPPSFSSGLRSFAPMVIGGYLLSITYFGAQVTIAGMGEASLTLGIPMSIPYSSVPIGSALAFAQLLAMASRRRGRVKDVWFLFLGSIAIFMAILIPDQVVKLHLPALVWLLLPALLLTEIPIAFAIGAFSMFLIATTRNASLTVAAQQLIAGVGSPALIAIPTFMLTGALLEATGMAGLLIDFFVAIVGRLRGGLAVADTLASAVFADISGSAVADTAAIGSVMIPSMVRHGYDEDFAIAHQAASGSLGTLLPPSITAIIFATVTGSSVVRLFRAAAIPGILLVFLFCVAAFMIASRRRYPQDVRRPPREIVSAFVNALAALVAPIFILGGILGGVFTPTETGAAATTYVAAIAVTLYRRRFSLERLMEAVESAVLRTTMVMYIIANTFILAWALAASGIPANVTCAIAAMSHDPRTILVVSAAFIIGLAVFLEPPAILTGAVPLLLPSIQTLGVDTATFGVVTLLAACIGNQIPPIGITLLVATSLGNVGIEKTARQIIPYTLLTALALLLVVLVPALTLVLAAK